MKHFPRLTLEPTTNPSNIQIYVKGENISQDTSIILNMSISQIFVNKFLLDSNCFTGIPWQWTTSGGDAPDRSYLRHSHPGLATSQEHPIYHVFVLYIYILRRFGRFAYIWSLVILIVFSIYFRCYELCISI